jgi:hypothetical protein
MTRMLTRHPLPLNYRRVPDPVERLRAVRHLLGVAQVVLVEKVELIVRI